MNDQTNGNGNGHSNGNGKPERELTPSEKAWETARAEAREQGRSVRDDEIRCIKNKGLSCWAKLLYWVLSKICWEKSPFLHNRRIGSVCATGRQLQTHFNFPQKRLYAQSKRKKDGEGKVLSTRRVAGAIEELETAGLVWMSRKRIENIPANKWPNVFNLTALVPQETQPGLGLLEDVVIVEDGAEVQYTNGGSSDFLAQNRGGSGQTPQKGPAKHQRGELAATNGGSGQAPLAGVGNNQRGELATPPVGCSGATDGGSSQEPTGGAAKPRQRGLPTPASGTPIRLSDVKTLTGTTLETASKRSTGFNALKAGSGRGKNLKAEAQFLEVIKGTFNRWQKGAGEEELATSGGGWRTRYRENPDLACRVIAEVHAMIKEGKSIVNPGACAMDLWQRWQPTKARHAVPA